MDKDVLKDQFHQILRCKQAIRELHEALDEHVWMIFSAYKIENDIQFTHPNTWSVSEKGVRFSGRDFEDYKDITIPLEFFTETESAFGLVSETQALEGLKRDGRAQIGRAGSTDTQETLNG